MTTPPPVASAEADAVALLTAVAGLDHDAARGVASQLASAPMSHRVLVAFLITERALVLDPAGHRSSRLGAEGQAVMLLRSNRPAQLRDLLRQQVDAASEVERTEFLLRLAQVVVDAADGDPAADLRAWGIAVALDPGGRGTRKPGTSG